MITGWERDILATGRGPRPSLRTDRPDGAPSQGGGRGDHRFKSLQYQPLPAPGSGTAALTRRAFFQRRIRRERVSLHQSALRLIASNL